MHQEQAGSVMPERGLNQLPWVDAAGGEGSFKKGFHSNHPVLDVKENDDEDFTLLVANGVIQIVEKLFGRSDRVLFDELLF